jgi:hypothetical protein
VERPGPRLPRRAGRGQARQWRDVKFGKQL